MFHNNCKQKWRCKQSGLGLPAAIFIIVVMALIAFSIHTLTEVGMEAHGEQLQSARAFYAAESGAQLAMGRLFPADGTNNQDCTDVPATYNFGATGVLGLTGCTVAVACVEASVDGASYFTIQSTGTCGIAIRVIEVRAKEYINQ